MRVLIVDKIHEILIEKLSEKGYICDYQPLITKEEIFDILRNYQGIVIRSKIKLTSEILNSAAGLKFIARVGAGLENIDVEYAEKNNILCLSSPEGNRDAVGEHAVALLLNLLHKINMANQEVKSGIWNRENNRGTEIGGKTVAIIGYGNMGHAFARRIQSFDCEIIAYDKYKQNFANNYVKEVELTDIFEYADILSLHVPLTAETEYLINDVFINKFRKNFYFVNTARGKCVKTDDLIQNIKSGKIKGAALDVLEWEKHSFEELYNIENKHLNFLKHASNIILSPHIAGLTDESFYKLSEVIAKKIIATNLA